MDMQIQRSGEKGHGKIHDACYTQYAFIVGKVSASGYR